MNKKNAEAAAFFQKEKVKWPESSHLMDRMIKVSAGSAASSAPAPQAVSEKPAPVPAAAPDSEEKKG